MLENLETAAAEGSLQDLQLPFVWKRSDVLVEVLMDRSEALGMCISMTLCAGSGLGDRQTAHRTRPHKEECRSRSEEDQHEGRKMRHTKQAHARTRGPARTA